MSKLSKIEDIIEEYIICHKDEFDWHYYEPVACRYCTKIYSDEHIKSVHPQGAVSELNCDGIDISLSKELFGKLLVKCLLREHNILLDAVNFKGENANEYHFNFKRIFPLGLKATLGV